jgi:hypothetical protein
LSILTQKYHMQDYISSLTKDSDFNQTVSS